MSFKKIIFLFLLFFLRGESKAFLSCVATVFDFSSVVFLIFKGSEVFYEFKNGTIAASFINSLDFIMNNETTYVPSMKEMLASLSQDKNKLIFDRVLFVGGVLGASWLLARLIRAIIKRNLINKKDVIVA